MAARTTHVTGPMPAERSALMRGPLLAVACSGLLD
jgi:hypothetical protein